MENSLLIRRWVRVGFVFGLSACTTYPLLLFLPMNTPLTVAVACTFGVSLSVASIGLVHLLSLHRRMVSLQLGNISNVIPGTAVNMILIGALLLLLNLFSFPTPASEAGFVDLSPALGVGYLALSIQVGRSFRRVDEQLIR